jgi:hypothetical protein
VAGQEIKTSRHFGGGSKAACKTIKGGQMSTRRNFLKRAAATGIAFCSCGMLDPARAQPKPPRLPVKVGGKRVMTVDVHSHCYFHEALNLMGDAAQKILPPVKGIPEHFIVIEQRLKEMDAMAIDMEYCRSIRSGTARTDKQKMAILGGNAARLFGLKVA